MITTAEKFLKTLRQEEKAPNLIVAWGDEAYYKDTIKDLLLDKIFAGVSAEERTPQGFSQTIDLAQLREAVNTYPFFSGNNFIVISDPKLLETDKKESEKVSEKKKDELKTFTDILADIPEYSYVLCLCEKLDKRKVFYKTLSQLGAIVECSSLKYYSLKPWLDEQAAKYGARFDYKATSLIMEYMSVTETVPLLLLEGEIAKLSIYAGKRKIWQAEDVAAIFSQLPEVSGFALGSAIASRHLGKALELLDIEQKKGSVNFIPVLARVSYEIRRLSRVKELMEKGYSKDKIVANLRMHPYAAQLTMDACRHFSLKALETCLVELSDINVELRAGGRQWPKLEEVLVTLLS